MLYRHYSDVPGSLWRWNNFDPGEPNLFCPCCGEFYLHVPSMDRLQWLREELRRPVKLNSGHRCPLHNARVGGAPLSVHKHFACDIDLSNHPNRLWVLQAARAVGFTGFGFYRTFLHVDMGRPRYWFGSGGQAAWTGLTF